MMAVAAALTATPAVAQETMPAAPASEEVQAWLVEAQQIQQRLSQVQQQVLADPQIAEEREALGEQVQAAMIEADPELEQSMEQIQELEPQMAEAQQAGDQERLNELVAQARAMEQRFQEAQSEALEDPTLRETVLAFNARIEERMLEIEPETPQLIERLRELQTRLQGGS